LPGREAWRDIFSHAPPFNLLASRHSYQREDAMAKGKDKGNKEAKKPKADKNAPKGAGSAYKQAQGKGGSSTVSTSGKK
jgi:hypothetical protein